MPSVAYLVLLFVCSVFAGVEFDYASLRPSYQAGETVDISVYFTRDAQLIGSPNVTIQLYDDLQNPPLVDIFGPQLLNDSSPNVSTHIKNWTIPMEMKSRVTLSDQFLLVMKSEYDQINSQGRITLDNMRTIIIHNVTAPTATIVARIPRETQLTADKTTAPIPTYTSHMFPANNYNPDSPSDTYDSVTLSDQSDYGATWAYNVVKALLVNQLL
ncbi:hypothetical protein K493DRAFT_317637 [Basidiobolus meristosporus CBS 931.73]|uniref:Uncharacterized protein n=1 Tax=Basidiobolus meristosporus CBS 931.73 TaxID=1314790 RepID=A0A1Y1XYV7_9FUNG|nr:hypothetical protein K493DRAFT_317637 [Basidiobolus meristosporus CBS 931.73]|eukprot:ORX90937.1 hypothetical protein K493DRAFT_317637 [Basidiobolus meristosporus CBS 931.73]